MAMAEVNIRASKSLANKSSKIAGLDDSALVVVELCEYVLHMRRRIRSSGCCSLSIGIACE